MKNKTLFLLIISMTLFANCSKDELAKKQTPGSKVVMASEYNPNYFPEGDVLELMTDFFNEVIAFQEDTSYSCTDLNLSAGGWYLTAGLNYLCADTMAQLDDFEEFTFYDTIELTGDELYELDGNSLAQCMLYMRTSINELNSEVYAVGAVECDLFSIDDEEAVFAFKALRGRIVTYDDVSLLDPPIGISPYTYLKMGVSYNGFESAAKETRKRYNPYLYQSKIASEVFADKKYLVTNLSSSYPILWTDWDNCQDDSPNKDYVLFIECLSPANYLDSYVYSSTFNNYLQKFFTHKITPLINQNLIYTQKTLYLDIGVNWLTSCYTCQYFNGEKKSVLAYSLFKANVSLISVPLPTL
jgi:hypothetical protein